MSLRGAGRPQPTPPPRRRSPLAWFWALLTRWSLAFPTAGVVVIAVALVSILLSGVSVLRFTDWTNNGQPTDLQPDEPAAQRYGFTTDGGKPWAPESGRLDVSDRGVTRQTGLTAAGEGAAAGTHHIVMKFQFRTRTELRALGGDAFELQLRVAGGIPCGADLQASRWARLGNATGVSVHGLPGATKAYASIEPGTNCREVAIRVGMLRPEELVAGVEYTADVDVPAGPAPSIGTTLTAAKRPQLDCPDGEADRFRCVNRDLALQSGLNAEVVVGQDWGFQAPGCRRWYSGATTSFPCLPATGARIMTLGDSIASGASEEYTWRYRVWQKLHVSVKPNYVGRKEGPWTGNYAVPSSKWDSAHDAQFGITAEKTEPRVADLTRSEHPDLVLIDLGTNDTHPLRGLSAEQTAAILDRIIQDIQGVNPDVQILIAQPSGHAATGPTIMANLAGLITQLAEQRRTSRSEVGVVDLRTGWRRDLDTFDGTHPSQLGEYFIAQRIVDRLAAVFAYGGRYGAIPTIAAPAAPKDVRALATGNSIQIEWKGVVQASEYRVYLRDTTAGGRFQVVGPGIKGQYNYNVPVAPTHEYEYYVTAVSSGLESEPSATGRIVAT
jgi:lysophospholipase L1-like esterase